MLKLVVRALLAGTEEFVACDQFILTGAEKRKLPPLYQLLIGGMLLLGLCQPSMFGIRVFVEYFNEYPGTTLAVLQLQKAVENVFV